MGSGNSPWLIKLLHHQQRFLVRWRSSYKLLNEKGELKKTYLHSVGKKAPYERLMKDTKTGSKLLVKLLFVPVRLADLADRPLTLLVCRQKRGRQPWYLLTNQPVTSEQQAWDLVLAYQRRWQSRSHEIYVNRPSASTKANWPWSRPAFGSLRTALNS